MNEAANPNGSLNNIAGITNRTRNVFGMMPHPERASDEIIGNLDGKPFWNVFWPKICFNTNKMKNTQKFSAWIGAICLLLLLSTGCWGNTTTDAPADPAASAGNGPAPSTVFRAGSCQKPGT